jgi:hypothetical protein
MSAAETKSFRSFGRFRWVSQKYCHQGTVDVSPAALSYPSLVNVDLMLPLVGRSKTLKTMSIPKFYSAINYDFRPESSLGEN